MLVEFYEWQFVVCVRLVDIFTTFFLDAGGEHEVSEAGSVGCVIIGKPGNGTKKMKWQGLIVEGFEDWFSLKIDLFNLAIDNTDSGSFAKRNFDNLAGLKWGFGGIGQDMGVLAENFSGEDLIIHELIITDCGII